MRGSASGMARFVKWFFTVLGSAFATALAGAAVYHLVQGDLPAAGVAG